MIYLIALEKLKARKYHRKGNFILGQMINKDN